MVSEKPWDTESVVRLFLGIFATLCLGIVFASSIEHWGGMLPAGERKFIQMIIMSLAFQGAAMVWVLFFLRERHVSWAWAFGFDQNAGRALILAAAVAFIVVPVAWFLQHLSGELMNLLRLKPVAQSSVQHLQTSISLPHQIYFGLMALVVAPIIEEVLFRGIIYPTIKQAGFPRLALWGTSVVFGVIHGNVLSFLPLVFLAVVFTWLYERTNNLLAPIFTHALFNAANFFFIVFAEPIERSLRQAL
jgi:membrane protease YdiL (CAAX protease family)